MKKYFMSLIIFISAVSAFAGETEICSTFDVPPLVAIGNAPAEKIHMLFASNDSGQSRITLLIKRNGLGQAMFTSECKQSRSDILCAKPEAGKGALQVLKLEETVSLKNVELVWVKNQSLTKILGSQKNMKLKAVDCKEFKDLMN